MLVAIIDSSPVPGVRLASVPLSWESLTGRVLEACTFPKKVHWLQDRGLH